MTLKMQKLAAVGCGGARQTTPLSELTFPGPVADPPHVVWIDSSMTSPVDCRRLNRWNVRQGRLRHTRRLSWPTNPLCHPNRLLFHRCRGIADGEALIQVAFQESANAN